MVVSISCCHLMQRTHQAPAVNMTYNVAPVCAVMGCESIHGAPQYVHHAEHDQGNSGERPAWAGLSLVSQYLSRIAAIPLDLILEVSIHLSHRFLFSANSSSVNLK